LTQKWKGITTSVDQVSGLVQECDDFWALRDINFEVKEGEVLGLVGRNGAGKSTLLKILSRICEPTEGHINMRGRVGSLLEVGTGFHPELTGRENVYLNGAMLGLRRDEISRRFDAIVDFSGVEAFINTPVKHYSSGMQARLGFAVAAHLEPEILIVDEVLSVGDAAFQEKCVVKMENASRSGRTVIYVSHNLGSLSRLCHRGIWIKDGCIYKDNKIDKVVDEYLDDTFGGKAIEEIKQRGIDGFEFTFANWIDEHGEVVQTLKQGESYTLALGYNNNACGNFSYLQLGFLITSRSGTHVINVNSRHIGAAIEVENNGRFELILNKLALVPGFYHVTVNLNSPAGRVAQIYSGLSLQVTDGDFYGKGIIALNSRGVYMPECEILSRSP
jgi:lipopolysaccharide transport system ATP-binding protein